MDPIQLAQGSYGKIKVTVPDIDLTEASQIFAMVYDDKGRKLKIFSKTVDDQADARLEIDEDDTSSIILEFLEEDTQKVEHCPRNYYCDVREFVNIDDNIRPLNNPSFLDENIIFRLHPSVTKDLTPDA